MCGDPFSYSSYSDDEGSKKVEETLLSDEETAQEKRLRLTKQYLAQLEEKGKT